MTTPIEWDDLSASVLRSMADAIDDPGDDGLDDHVLDAIVATMRHWADEMEAKDGNASGT